jgi:hypothetical protein
MKMKDWTEKLDSFLKFNEYGILTDAGKISHEVAKTLAEDEYSRFRVKQDQAFESDFEREIKRINKKDSKK